MQKIGTLDCLHISTIVKREKLQERAISFRISAASLIRLSVFSLTTGVAPLTFLHFRKTIHRKKNISILVRFMSSNFILNAQSHTNAFFQEPKSDLFRYADFLVSSSTRLCSRFSRAGDLSMASTPL